MPFTGLYLWPLTLYKLHVFHDTWEDKGICEGVGGAAGVKAGRAFQIAWICPAASHTRYAIRVIIRKRLFVPAYGLNSIRDSPTARPMEVSE